MAFIPGTPFPDNLLGTSAVDQINAGDGNDFVIAGLGQQLAPPLGDIVRGEGGNDIIFGDLGFGGPGDRDGITGGPGNDQLNGEGGSDFLAGDEGDDQLSGGDGNDVLMGGSSQDVLDGGAGADFLFVNGNDTASGGPGADRFFVDLGGFPNPPPTLLDFNPAEGDTLSIFASTAEFDNFTDGFRVAITGPVFGVLLSVSGPQTPEYTAGQATAGEWLAIA